MTAAVTDDRAGGGNLARSQADRRRRIIAAALELAAERGHPDDIQMRDIAERSGVALGTIYRYFESKQRLLGAALVAWASELQSQLALRPPAGGTTTDRAVAVLRRAARAIEANPALARTLFLAASTPSPTPTTVQRDLDAGVGALLDGVLSDVDGVTRRGLQRVLAHVWYSALLGWVNGWRRVTEIGDELEFTARWLLSGEPPVV